MCVGGGGGGGGVGGRGWGLLLVPLQYAITHNFLFSFHLNVLHPNYNWKVNLKTFDFLVLKISKTKHKTKILEFILLNRIQKVSNCTIRLTIPLYCDCAKVVIIFAEVLYWIIPI